MDVASALAARVQTTFTIHIANFKLNFPVRCGRRRWSLHVLAGHLAHAPTSSLYLILSRSLRLGRYRADTPASTGLPYLAQLFRHPPTPVNLAERLASPSMNSTLTSEHSRDIMLQLHKPRTGSVPQSQCLQPSHTMYDTLRYPSAAKCVGACAHRRRAFISWPLHAQVYEWR